MTSTLKVDTIANSGGTTGMTIDSSGRVTEPNKPMWHVYRKTGGGGSGVQGVIVFNTAHTNVGTMCNLSTGIVTVPVAGTYYIYANLLATNSTGGAMGEDMNAFIQVDSGSGFSSKAVAFADYTIIGSGGSGYMTVNLHLTYPLSASDQIRINLTSGYTYVENADDPFTSFGGFLIG